MATPTLKSTFSLDLETARTLEALASRWKVSKSEALRRAVRATAAELAAAPNEAVGALDALQRSLRLTRVAARRWEREARSERRAASRRAERRDR